MGTDNNKVKKYIDDKLKVTVVPSDDESITIFFDGELYIADDHTEERLQHYFDYLFIKSTNYKEIFMNFKNLHSISSYGIRLIITWLKKLHDYIKKNNEVNHKVHIYYDDDIEWQEPTFLSLKEIFKEIADFNK